MWLALALGTLLWSPVARVSGLIPIPPVNASAYRIAVNNLEFGLTSDEAYVATIAKWQPTMDYINQFGIGNRTAEILPVNTGVSFVDHSYDIYRTLREKPGVIDAILIDPMNSVCLNTIYTMRPLAGWVAKALGVKLRTFRGVMVAPLNSTLQRIDDIKGRNLMFTFNLFASLDMQMMFSEMNQRGAYVFNDARMILFAEDHVDQFIKALIDGVLDATFANYHGLVGYNVYASVPLVFGKNVKVVEERVYPDFPFPSSGTYSYPSWSMISLETKSDADEYTANRVSEALLQMPSNTPVTNIAQYDSWTHAFNNDQVKEFMKAQGRVTQDDKCVIYDTSIPYVTRAYNTITCKPGTYRISLEAALSSCKQANITCPAKIQSDGFCVCSPCLAVPEKPISIVLRSQFSANMTTCSKLDVCAVRLTNEDITVHVLDHYGSYLRSLLGIDNVTTVEYAYIKSSADVSHTDFYPMVKNNNGTDWTSKIQVTNGYTQLLIKANGNLLQDAPTVIYGQNVDIVCAPDYVVTDGVCMLRGNVQGEIIGGVFALVLLLVIGGMYFWYRNNRYRSLIILPRDIIIDSEMNIITNTVMRGTYKSSRIVIKLPYPIDPSQNQFGRGSTHLWYNNVSPIETADALLLNLADIEVLKRLNHPNLVAIIGAVVMPDSKHRVSLVMEDCDRGSLTDLLNSRAVVDSALLVSILYGVISALVFLDQCGLHPIVNLSNVLLTDRFHAKLLLTHPAKALLKREETCASFSQLVNSCLDRIQHVPVGQFKTGSSLTTIVKLRELAQIVSSIVDAKAFMEKHLNPRDIGASEDRLSSESMRGHSHTPPRMYDAVTVLFADIVGFSALTRTLEPEATQDLASLVHGVLDQLAAEYGLFPIQASGATYMVCGGMPEPSEKHAANVARFAMASVRAVRSIQVAPGLGRLEIRCGVHSGPATYSQVGRFPPRFFLFGDTVTLASQLEESSEQGQILASAATATLVREQDPSLAPSLHVRGWLHGKGGCVWIRDAHDDDTQVRPRIVWTPGALLGKGAYGRVYMGLNRSNGKLMAVKVLEYSQTEGYAEWLIHLQSEIDMCQSLKHENIVGYDGVQDDPSPDGGNPIVCIFMEYVPGGSVASILDKFGALDESVARSYTRQLLLGLDYLHTAGVIHRDIKGGNILVGREGVIKLADFGAAKQIIRGAMETANWKDSIGAHSLKGSVYWMAPEVLANKPYGRRADVWSVGATLLEMLTSAPPWSELTEDVKTPWAAAQLITAAVGKGVTPAFPEDISLECALFLRRCFQVDPESRPSAAELLNDPFMRSQSFQEPSTRYDISNPSVSAMQFTTRTLRDL